MTSYEGSSLTEIEAVLDGLTEATSAQVYDATLGYNARAVAAVAASRADAAGGASFPPEWTIGAGGSLYIDNSVTGDTSLLVDGGGNTNSKIAVFRQADGKLVGYFSSHSGLFAPGVDRPTLEVSKDQVVVNLDVDTAGTFLVSDYDGNTLLEQGATGALGLAIAPGDTSSDPVSAFLEDGTLAFRSAFSGTFYFSGFHARVSPTGHLITSAHSAPIDDDLSAGECAIWFDQTDGAAKLMLKAKQADGTVKTGSVNVQT